MNFPKQTIPVFRNVSPHKSCVTGLKPSTLIDFGGCVEQCKRTPTFAPRTRNRSPNKPSFIQQRI